MTLFNYAVTLDTINALFVTAMFCYALAGFVALTHPR
jgi:hypothetical protein